MTPSFHNFGLSNYNRMNFSVVSSHQVCAITSAYITHLYYYLYYIMYCNIYCIICIQFVLNDCPCAVLQLREGQKTVGDRG